LTTVRVAGADGVPVLPLDLASVLLWLAVAGVVISRAFRWESRA
jgi:hypothetical protein